MRHALLRIALAALLSPATSIACPVCIGSTRDEAVRAYLWSALGLTPLPFVVVGLIAAGIVRLRRRGTAGEQ